MPRPTFQKSRGPNGRHLAPLTPYMDDPGLVITTIKPSGGLAFGLRDYTTKDLQDGWDIVNEKAGSTGWGMVLMEPGAIRGYGGGFNDDPALLNVGGVRKNRILFWGTKGWGTVQFAGSSVKITNPQGWTLAGVRGGAEDEFGVLVVSSENFGMWRSTAQYFNSNGASGEISNACDFVECVKRESWVFETDSAAVRGSTITKARPTPGPITGTNYVGCYLAPTWRPVTSGSHTDTLQWSGDSPYGDSTVEDSVLFASTNHGMIVGGTATNITVRNTAVIGAQVNLKRYPVTGVAPADSDYAGKAADSYNDPYVLNGTGAAGQMKIYDSLFIGRIINLQNIRAAGGVVSNVITTYSAAKANDSRFTLDESYLNWTAADLDREFPFPTDARLAAIWAVDVPTVPTDPTDPDPEPDPEIPSGALTQDVMPSYAQAWALASAPTLTFSTAATVSGVSVAPTDAKVAHTGPAAKAIVPSTLAGYYRPNYLADISTAGSSTNPRLMPAYGTKIRTTSKIVEIALQQRPDLSGAGVSTRTPIRIKVDGQWTSRRPIFLGADGNIGYDGMTPSFISPGTKFWVKLEFPSAADREIEIQSMLEYAGWTVPAGQSFGTATPPKHTVVWDMDSLAGGEKHGTGNYSLSSPEGTFQHATYTHLSSLIWYASQTIGYDSVVNSSSGSSGYNINGDTVKYITEERGAFDVIEHDPELVVVGTGVNDVAAGQSAAQLQANAVTTMNRIKAGVPDAIRVMLGLPSVPAVAALGGATALTPFNAALKAAAQATGTWFLDPVLGDLFNPDGVRVADKPNMVTGNEAKISSDKTHPTQAGADFFGSGYIADMLRLVHPAVGTGGPVEPPVDTTDPVVEWVTLPDPAVPLSGTAVLIVNASPASNIESVTFAAIVSGKAVPLPGVTRGAGDNWVLTFNTPAVANNDYVVRATAKARNGKTADASQTFTVDNSIAVPNVAPVVTFLEPAAGAVLPRTGQVVFRGRATDDKYVASTGFRFRTGGVLGDPIDAAPAVVGNGIFELSIDAATLIAQGYDGAAFTATDTGAPPLTSTTSVVPFTIAPIIDRTPPTDFVLRVVASGPGELTGDWDVSSDVAGQKIMYRVIFNGLQVGSNQEERIRVFTGLTAGSKPSIRIVAFDEDENVTSSNEVTDVVVVGEPTVITLEKPTLTYVDLTDSSVGLEGGAPIVTSNVVAYELRRRATVLRRSPDIADFAYVKISDLTESTDYQYALYSVGAGDKLSDPAVVSFRTPPKPIVIAPGWFETGPSKTEGSSGPVYGDVLVRYSSDIRTTDGRQLTPTQQVVKASDGRFLDPATGTPWQGYRSPNAEDYIEWIEKFLGPDGRTQTRQRRFRFPPAATGPAVEYLDRIWLDDAPVGTSLPVWAQELDAKVARVERAAQQVKDAVDAMAFVLMQDTDGVYYPKPTGE